MIKKIIFVTNKMFQFSLIFKITIVFDIPAISRTRKAKFSNSACSPKNETAAHVVCPKLQEAFSLPISTICFALFERQHPSPSFALPPPPSTHGLRHPLYFTQPPFSCFLHFGKTQPLPFGIMYAKSLM